MHTIRILAVEDDELHADVLRMHLDRMGYDLIDIVDNSAEALRLLKATDPDLLLMDIDIGEEQTGIDLVKRINQFADVPVIYLTSFREKPIFDEARQTLPDAYILKPFDPAELQRAIELAFLRHQQARKLKQTKALPGQSAANVDYVFVKDGDRLVKVCVRDILLVEAYDKYCLVYTRAKKYLLTIQLRVIAESLLSEQFLQVHRSYIINFDAVEQVSVGQGTIEIAGKQVPISKTYKTAFFSRMHVL